MKSSTMTSKLFESVHQHLNMRALAAVLAVVGMLVLVQPAEAKIVYTPSSIQVGLPAYNLDLNHDGITDFRLYRAQSIMDTCRGGFTEYWLREAVVQGNGVVISAFYATALPRGVKIGPNQSFVSDWRDLAFVEGGWVPGRTRCSYLHNMGGNWANVSNRYLGMKFRIKGKTHYGWARLSVQVGYVYIHATLTGYAYETIPGKSIKAGQRKEAADDPTEDDFGSDTFLSIPLPHSPQPASRGALTLDAQSIPLWRRKESDRSALSVPEAAA
jgi:hypothetical protein